MRRAGTVLVVVTVVAAPLLATVPRSAALAAGLAACRLAAFSASMGPRVSEATGQGTLIFRLTNGPARCEVSGYPTVSFADRHGSIPFEIADRGDQMITRASPRAVVVRPRGTVVVAINKYRCDLATRRVATSVSFRTGRSAIRVELAHASRKIEWCGYGDPGSTVDVTPFEPSVRATQRH